jgi:hypothetical protein
MVHIHTTVFQRIKQIWKQKLETTLAEYHLTTHRPDDGGSKYLWNVGKLLPDYTALQPRRHPSSYSPPREPEILHVKWSQLYSACCICCQSASWRRKEAAPKRMTSKIWSVSNLKYNLINTLFPADLSCHMTSREQLVIHPLPNCNVW